MAFNALHDVHYIHPLIHYMTQRRACITVTVMAVCVTEYHVCISMYLHRLHVYSAFCAVKVRYILHVL